MQPGQHKIEAAIFDIGRVLIDFEFDLAFRAAEPLINIPAAEIRQRLFGKSDFTGYDRERDVVAFECGRISESEFHRRVEKSLGCQLPLQRFTELWNCIFKAEIKPTVALARKLQKEHGVKIGILSNTNETHFEVLRQKLDLLNELEHVYASHEIGYRKPDAESFQHVLQEMNVAPQRTIFVDDLIENVRAAEQLGMHGIHATDPESVRAGIARIMNVTL